MIKIIQRGNATIKIHRPDLTEEEKKKRENKILLALQQFEKGSYKGG